MGNLLKETPFSEIIATLEVLDHYKVTREHLKCIRSDAALAKRISQIVRKGVELVHFDRELTLIEVVSELERRGLRPASRTEVYADECYKMASFPAKTSVIAIDALETCSGASIWQWDADGFEHHIYCSSKSTWGQQHHFAAVPK